MVTAVFEYYERELASRQLVINELMELLKCQQPVAPDAMDKCEACGHPIKFDWGSKTWRHLGKQRHVAWPTYHKLWIKEDETEREIQQNGEWVSSSASRELVYVVRGEESEGEI